MSLVRHPTAPTLRGIDREERGVSLPLIALSMVALLGLAALAVDLGWLYVNTSRAQQAADGAALAAVVHLPQQPTAANTAGLEIAASNGFRHGIDATVTVTPVSSTPPQVEVTVTRTVDLFFMRVFGFESADVTRVAAAEYLPPLPLGSPDSSFGNSCDPGEAGCTGQPNYWANIHGRYTESPMGDAFSSFCSSGNGSAGCSQNPNHRTDGYLYGIERGSNAGFTIQFLDMAHHNTSGGEDTADSIRTGDRGCEAWGDDTASCGQPVTANLYGPDATPLDITDNPLLCSHTWAPEPQVEEDAPYSYESPSGCFTVASAQPGIYVLQIVLPDPAAPQYSGLNRYSLRVSAGSQLYGLGDFSIYNNSAGTTRFYMAEVADFYAGKTFVIELFDPGESPQPGTLQVIGPNGAVWGGGCRVFSKGASATSWNLQSSPTVCEESVSPSEYHNRWLKFEIDLPTDYACASCWWQINYAYPAGVTDTTTWRGYIVGNPIRLIPNG